MHIAQRQSLLCIHEALGSISRSSGRMATALTPLSHPSGPKSINFFLDLLFVPVIYIFCFFFFKVFLAISNQYSFVSSYSLIRSQNLHIDFQYKWNSSIYRKKYSNGRNTIWLTVTRRRICGILHLNLGGLIFFKAQKTFQLLSKVFHSTL